MDTALKQRLIGATLLVVLAVIFLPMLVKGPAPESGVESVSLDVPPPPGDASHPSTQELPLVAMQPPRPAQAHQQATQLLPSPARAPAVNDHAQQEKGGLDPAMAAGDFSVHFGVFTQAAQAQAIASTLQQAHLDATVEKIPDRQQLVWRVNIGPFADQAQAQAARVQASARIPGHVAEVVVANAHDTFAPALERPQVAGQAKAVPVAPARSVPQPAAASDTVTSRRSSVSASANGPSVHSVGFTIQVGAYSLVGDANALRDRLRMAGFSAYVEAVQTPTGPLHRVRVGPVADRAAADQLKAQLAAKVRVNGLIRPYP